MTSNPYAVPSHFTVQLSPCCGDVLLGEVCGCVGIPPESITPTYPTPIVLVNVGGLLKRVEATA